MPKPVLYKVLFLTSVSFSIQVWSFFYIQHFTIQKHVVAFARFDLYLISRGIHHLLVLKNSLL